MDVLKFSTTSEDSAIFDVSGASVAPNAAAQADSSATHDELLAKLRDRIAQDDWDAQYLREYDTYLLQMEAQYRSLRLEQMRTLDELEYVRAKWRLAEERCIDVEAKYEAAQFDRELAGIEKAAAELRFDEIDEHDHLSDVPEQEEHQKVSNSPPESNCPQQPEKPHEKQLPYPAAVDIDSFRSGLLIAQFRQRIAAKEYALAVPLCERLVAELASLALATPEQSRTLAAAYEMLSMYERTDHRPSDAAHHLQLAADIYQSICAPSDPIHANMLSQLCTVYHECGQLQSARTAGKQALALRKRVDRGRRNYRCMGRQMHCLALVERDDENLERSIKWYERALDAYADVRHVSDPADPQPTDDAQVLAAMVVACRTELAELFGQRQGRWSAAAAVYTSWLWWELDGALKLPTASNGKRAHRLIRKLAPIWLVCDQVERLPLDKRPFAVVETLSNGDYSKWWAVIAALHPHMTDVLCRLMHVYRCGGRAWSAQLLLMAASQSKKVQVMFVQ